MSTRKTPRTDAAIECGGRGIVSSAYTLIETSRELEVETQELADALDTLTLVIGLTPIAGNKGALQEAVDISRSALTRHKANQP